MQISDEALFVLGSLSQRPLSVQEILAHLHLDHDIPWTNLEEYRVTRILHYLKKDNLIDWTPDPPGRLRKYLITETGREILTQWLQDTNITERPNFFPFDLGINALGVLTLVERQKLINHHRIAIYSLIEKNKSINKNLQAHQVVQRVIVQHHLAYLQGEIDWLDQLEMDLSSFDYQEKIIKEQT
jgi:DNA-binding PadR family transcriptional regulator